MKSKLIINKARTGIRATKWVYNQAFTRRDTGISKSTKSNTRRTLVKLSQGLRV